MVSEHKKLAFGNVSYDIVLLYGNINGCSVGLFIYLFETKTFNVLYLGMYWLQVWVFPFFKQEEVNEATSVLSIYAHNIKVTEVLQDGDTLTFIIISQKVGKRIIFRLHRLKNDVEWFFILQ